MFVYTLKSITQETTPVYFYYLKAEGDTVRQDIIWTGVIKDIPDYLLNEIIIAMSVSANHGLFIEIKKIV